MPQGWGRCRVLDWTMPSHRLSPYIPGSHLSVCLLAQLLVIERVSVALPSHSTTFPSPRLSAVVEGHFICKWRGLPCLATLSPNERYPHANRDHLDRVRGPKTQDVTTPLQHSGSSERQPIWKSAAFASGLICLNLSRSVSYPKHFTEATTDLIIGTNPLRDLRASVASV